MAEQPVVSSGSLLHVKGDLPSIVSPILGTLGPFSIATSTITIILILFLFLWLCKIVSKVRLIPNTFQHILELFYEFTLSFISSLVGDDAVAKKIIPYIGAVLLYLLVSNLLFMVPFLSSFYVTIGGEHVELFRVNTTDFNTTFGLALAVIILLQVIGIKEQGVLHYLGHFIKIKEVVQGFRKSLSQGVISIMTFMVGLIEIISEITKIFSLSLRLFGNMFAHELIAVILLGAFSFFVPVIWMGFGLLVGIVQAIVFISLITVYYSMVLNKDSDNL